MILAENGVPGATRVVRPFLTDVSIVLLVVISLVQLAQTLLSPAGSILSIPFIAIVLVGVYGLYRLKRWGYYVTLIVSVLQVVAGLLGTVSLLVLPRLMPQIAAILEISASVILQGAISTAFYLIALVCVVKTWHPVQKQVQLPVEVTEASVSEANLAVEVVDLTKTYRIGTLKISALRGVNLKVRRGEFVAIVGPSGSGKSTLLNVLGALDKPTSGHVFIDGVDISGLRSGALARLRNEKIGFVFQAYNLIARSTVMRNIELPAMVRGLSRSDRFTRASGLLEATGIGDKAPRKPTALSGGEQQRVAIARALINDPAIILADEPTGNVDSKVGMEIVALLRRINKERGATIIVVTHNVEVANATDRIIHLRDGVIEREEILNEIKQKS